MTALCTLTVGQAIIRFLSAQHVERDGITTPFFGGAFGIFGHGNVAGLGQALLQYADNFRYFQGRNEQGMVHAGIGYAKARNRLGALAVTTSIGPGATNMVTGAATATVNRLPVLLLPSDYFATRRAGSVLQQIEVPSAPDISSTDAFRPVSAFWDRVLRPEQLPEALLGAMRVLTSPADTGAATIALPQDVQAEAFDFPAELFAPRVWHIARPRADLASLQRARQALRQAQRPMVIAGGGVIYADALEELADFVTATGIPVGVTQAGKASLPADHLLNVGAIGASGQAFANSLAREADLVIGIGTRYTDFTTASNTLFQNPHVQFINLNITEFDAAKQSAISVVGDARESLRELTDGLNWQVSPDYRHRAQQAATDWRHERSRLIDPGDDEGTLSQAAAIGIVNSYANHRDVVINAAGSMPGDLHRLWDPGALTSYGIEYGYSCMGYEIAAGLGAKLADPNREVLTFIGDGSYLMLSSELLTSVQEGLKQIVFLVDNQGFGSIGALSRQVGSQGFGCQIHPRDVQTGRFSESVLQVDFPANAASYGARVLTAATPGQLHRAMAAALADTSTVVVYLQVDAHDRFRGSGAWWDVPISEVSTLETTQQARTAYVSRLAQQRRHL